MRKYLFYLHPIILIVFSVTCAGKQVQRMSDKADNPIYDCIWKLVSLEGRAIKEVGERDPYAVFGMQESRIYGSGGCNRFSGNFEIKGQNIRIYQIISTKMACLEIDYENDYFRILELSNEYMISGDSLFLRTDGIVRAVFVHSDSGLYPHTPE